MFLILNNLKEKFIYSNNSNYSLGGYNIETRETCDRTQRGETMELTWNGTLLSEGAFSLVEKVPCKL